MSNSKIIERLKRKRFFSIGRAGMDLYAEPPGTEFEQANNFSAHVGGSAANIAAERPATPLPITNKSSGCSTGAITLPFLNSTIIQQPGCPKTPGHQQTSICFKGLDGLQ